MQIKSIRFQTTLLYSGILLVILLAYNAGLFFAVRSFLLKDIDEDLRIKAGEIANILQAYEKIGDVSSHPLSILENLLHANGVLPKREVIIDDLWRSEFETLRLKQDYINILDSQGRPRIHSSNVTAGVSALVLDRFGSSPNRTYFGEIRTPSMALRVVNLPFVYKEQLVLIIQVATPLAPVNRFLARLMAISSVCILVIIALTSFLGSFFVRRILAPVVAVTRAADRISHHDLSTRISAPDNDIEMRRLITSFNAMIERLEQSFRHIHEFNSYVAHELKTPLAIMRGELELAVEQAQGRDAERKILSDCLEEVDRMIRIIKDLLLLAKLDYQPQILKFAPIDFVEFLQEIYDHAVILAAEKQIQVTFHCPGTRLIVNGDKVHLRRLFLNIVTNAIKYTPAAGSLCLTVRPDRQELHVDIADTGEGIAEADLGRIFDKFFRVERGERSQVAGFGLGLSIALSIAKAHQGLITVRSRIHEGTTFTVTLPLAA